MIVCIFEHVQWRWAPNGSTARGQPEGAGWRWRRGELRAVGPAGLGFFAPGEVNLKSTGLTQNLGQL